MTRLLDGLRRRESPSVLSGDLSRLSVENAVYALTAACLLVVVLARSGRLSPDA